MNSSQQGDPSLERAQEINALVKDVWLAIEREGANYAEPRLTGQQHAVLDLVVSHPKITASEIAEKLAITRGAVSQHLTVLVDRDYVKRTRSKHDGRSQVLELAQRGLDYEQSLEQFEKFAVKRYLSCLSKQDLEDVVTALEKLKSAFGSC